MSSLFSTLGIDRPPTEERLQLVCEIVASLEEHADLPSVSEAQLSELYRRLDALDAHPDAVSTWEDVKHRLQQKLRR